MGGSNATKGEGKGEKTIAQTGKVEAEKAKVQAGKK